ncbi:MAG: AEC family transporter [Campylobacteraceae bacterium]|nr:AEC family transporter [Campylobacteraceae bacterium]
MLNYDTYYGLALNQGIIIDNIISILSIYFFVGIGFTAKTMLKKELNEKSIVKLNIYFLLPILAFWGLLTQKIDINILKVPLLYLLICIIALIFTVFIAKKTFQNPKDISIVSMASVTGITGSIGIPLGISLLSESSVIYTSLINTASMIFVYTVGVYIYSRGRFSIKKSFVNVFKMPIIWASIVAIIFNLLNIQINKSFFKTLEMGAYGAIVMQLIIFGIFLKEAKIKEVSLKLLGIVMSLKFILIPVIATLVLYIFHQELLPLNSLMLELIVPLAITNVSLASIFDCKPKLVTSLVFISSIIFIPYVMLAMYFLK